MFAVRASTRALHAGVPHLSMVGDNAASTRGTTDDLQNADAAVVVYAQSVHPVCYLQQAEAMIGFKKNFKQS